MGFVFIIVLYYDWIHVYCVILKFYPNITELSVNSEESEYFLEARSHIFCSGEKVGHYLIKQLPFSASDDPIKTTTTSSKIVEYLVVLNDSNWTELKYNEEWVSRLVRLVTTTDIKWNCYSFSQSQRSELWTNLELQNFWFAKAYKRSFFQINVLWKK